MGVPIDNALFGNLIEIDCLFLVKRGPIMNRSLFRRRIPLLLAFALAMLVVSGGCVNALATMMLLIKGTNVDPEFKHLKGKKVAVVVRQTADLQYTGANVPQELAMQIGALLQKNVDKITVISQQKVADWCDNHNPDEVYELGRGLKADMVVSVELNGFELYQGHSMYQGRAIASIQVIDCRDSEKIAKDKALSKIEKGSGINVVFEKQMPESKYPPNIGVPRSDMQEYEFRKKFVTYFGDQIARHFYPHDSHADFATDVTSMK
jgi:ABC-type uncharacterized transport system auxiliary subunit